MFNVTMQNHSPFLSGKVTGGYKLGYEGKMPEANEYMNLVAHSDAAAKKLINYFKKVDEDTIVLFFGDHQPKIEGSFFSNMKKTFKILACVMTLALVALVFASCGAKTETLTMATNAEFPPYEYYDGDKIVGIDAEIAQAIADYTKAIELNPKDATHYNNRGIAHRKLGNAAQAEADFAKARELEAQNQ